MGSKRPGITTPRCVLRTVESGITGVPAGQIVTAYVLDDRLLFKGGFGEMSVPYADAKSFRIINDEFARDKSAVGRAVVGGALLGPVGAVVGAASGMGTKRVRRTLLSVYGFRPALPILAEVFGMTPGSLKRFVKALSSHVMNAG